MMDKMYPLCVGCYIRSRSYREELGRYDVICNERTGAISVKTKPSGEHRNHRRPEICTFCVAEILEGVIRRCTSEWGRLQKRGKIKCSNYENCRVKMIDVLEVFWGGHLSISRWNLVLHSRNT